MSCSKTFQNLGQATHCGGCSQCVDRRFAAYAAKADDIDGSGIYANDIISTAISDREMKTTVLDYVRQARNFSRWNDDHFFVELATELADVVDYLPAGGTEFERVRLVMELCKRHGDQVALAMNRMREEHDDLYSVVPRDSLLGLISDREYLNAPVALLVKRLERVTQSGHRKYVRCQSTKGRSGSEHQDRDSLELARRSTYAASILRSPSRDAIPYLIMGEITRHPHRGEVLARSYLTHQGVRRHGGRYDKVPPGQAHSVVVYDPRRMIIDDQVFKRDFESLGRCTVLIVR